MFSNPPHVFVVKMKNINRTKVEINWISMDEDSLWLNYLECIRNTLFPEFD